MVTVGRQPHNLRGPLVVGTADDEPFPEKAVTANFGVSSPSVGGGGWGGSSFEHVQMPGSLAPPRSAPGNMPRRDSSGSGHGYGSGHGTAIGWGTGSFPRDDLYHDPFPGEVPRSGAFPNAGAGYLIGQGDRLSGSRGSDFLPGSWGIPPADLGIGFGPGTVLPPPYAAQSGRVSSSGKLTPPPPEPPRPAASGWAEFAIPIDMVSHKAVPGTAFPNHPDVGPPQRSFPSEMRGTMPTGGRSMRPEQPGQWMPAPAAGLSPAPPPGQRMVLASEIHRAGPFTGAYSPGPFAGAYSPSNFSPRGSPCQSFPSQGSPPHAIPVHVEHAGDGFLGGHRGIPGSGADAIVGEYQMQPYGMPPQQAIAMPWSSSHPSEALVPYQQPMMEIVEYMEPQPPPPHMLQLVPPPAQAPLPAIRRPLPPAPKPPCYYEVLDKRPHTLEIELAEVEMHPHAKIETKWYEACTYFMSFHPLSVDPDTAHLPRDAPRATKDKEVLVSKTVGAAVPKVKVGVQGEEDAEPNPVSTFNDKMSIALDQLDLHLFVYLWGRKASVASSEILLVGRFHLPLRDYKVQRMPQTWGCFDLADPTWKVADVRMTHSVSTTPGPITLPSLTDVKCTELTLQWSPPQNDHGAPVDGYKLSIMLSKGKDGAEWHTLCEKTKSTNPVYVVTNLTGNQSYLIDIRAVNRVGVGDPHNFEVATAPVEPDPTCKPWIDDTRDGALCIAWRAAKCDGGAEVSHFKVQMKKSIGATRLNSILQNLGAKAHETELIDMGTVGASMQDRDRLGAYTAWLGPLEETHCAYAFQVIAVSAAGVSKPSPLSDPHYT